ncbi:MAG: biotin/lipoyl-binding protein, partial [Bacteroidales bacterium]
MDNKVIVSLLIGAFVVVSCGDKDEKKNDEGVETALVAEPNQVNVSILRKTNFKHELISNGKVVAANSADLYFESAEPVRKINVKNGDHVKKGDVIAILDRFKLQNRLKQAKDEHERSYLELQDVLIGQGYSPDDTIRVPK